MIREFKWGVPTRIESHTILESLKTRSSHVRHDHHTREQFMLVAGTIEGKEALREEGFLVFDFEDMMQGHEWFAAINSAAFN